MNQLQPEWCYYQLNNSNEQTIRSWADSLKVVGKVRTVPELLYTLDKIATIGLENLTDLNFFKGSVQPMWEHPANINGGRCTLEIPLAQRDSLMAAWRSTVAFCASNTIESINGCVFSEKTTFKIYIWISDPSDAEAVIKAWRELIPTGNHVFSFSLHNKHSDHFKGKKKYNGGFRK